MSEKKRSISKTAAVASVAAVTEAIVASFGSPAIAETGGAYNSIDLDVTANDMCVPAGGTYTVNDTVVTSDYPATAELSGTLVDPDSFYITEVSFSNAVNIADPLDYFSIIPVASTFNNYPEAPIGSPPGDNPINFAFSFTAPEVDVLTGSADYSVDITASARNWTYAFVPPPGGFVWGSIQSSSYIVSNTDEQESFTITVEHANTAPSISTDPSTVEIVSNGDGTSDITVNATVNDEEGNEVDMIFELSDDDFDTIVQSGTYSDIDLQPGEDYVQSHTFSTISPGEYNWRVGATETGTDVVGACTGGEFVDPPFAQESIGLVSEQPIVPVRLSQVVEEPAADNPAAEDLETLASTGTIATALLFMLVLFSSGFSMLMRKIKQLS